MTPTHGFDPVVHASSRLEICSLLAAVDAAEFATVRDSVALSDSALSKHARTLEKAGYVKVTKGTVGSRTRTWLSLTPAGRRAFDGHVLALQELIGRPRSPTAT